MDQYGGDDAAKILTDLQSQSIKVGKPKARPKVGGVRGL
jgi:hypothetical protein